MFIEFFDISMQNDFSIAYILNRLLIINTLIKQVFFENPVYSLFDIFLFAVNYIEDRSLLLNAQQRNNILR